MRFRFGDYEVDAGRFALTRRGHAVPIEPGPLRLLLYLLERHPESVSKNELLDALWGGTAVTEGSLTRAVREVRRALRERADEVGTIRTVRGRGYAIGCAIERVGAAGKPAWRQKTKHQLLALLSADAVGYSRLLAEDETATVAAIEAARKQMGARVTERAGRVVDAVGDNVLAQFASAVEAVGAAVAIQQDLGEGRLRFRIGIHLGEVLESEGRIYGDAVNVAARLERLAAPGGLCVSDVVAGEVKGRLEIAWEDAGEQRLKNIARPVRAFRALGDGSKPAVGGAQSKHDVSDPLVPERPSLVVLPFQNLTGNVEREFIADGLTEELTARLSQNPHVIVISRTSAFTYKGQSIRIDEVGRELGVRYVVEGSVRESPGRLRFTLQLIEASIDRHLWAESFDARPDAIHDLIALQSEMAEQVLVSLGAELSVVERARNRFEPTADPRAYEAVLRGWQYFVSYRRGGMAEARRLFERATEIDPEYAVAQALVGAALLVENWWFGWGREPEALEHAEASVRRALDLDPGLPDALSCLAGIRLRQGRLDEAADAARLALERNPNLYEAYAWLAQIEGIRDNVEAAMRHMECALRVNPLATSPLHTGVAMLQYREGKTGEAVAMLERIRETNPEVLLPRIVLLSHYALVGDRDSAQGVLSEVRAVCTDLAADDAATLIFPDTNSPIWKALEALLRIAGLPGGRAPSPD